MDKKQFYSQSDINRNHSSTKMPNVISRNAMTLATPVNELKFYYHVSDLIGNNYSPQAKSLNIKSINDFSKSNEMSSNKGTSSFSRIACQSVPDYLFASTTSNSNRNSLMKEASFNKLVKLPPIVDNTAFKQKEDETIDSASIFLNNEHSESVSLFEASKTSFMRSLQSKSKLSKRKVFANNFFDDENETISVKSFGSKIHFTNSTSSKSLSVNYGPSRYKIKRSQSLVCDDTVPDSLSSKAANNFDTIQEQNSESEQHKENSRLLKKNSNSKIEDLFSILISNNADKKKSNNSRLKFAKSTTSMSNSKLFLEQKSKLEKEAITTSYNEISGRSNRKNDDGDQTSRMFFSKQDLNLEKLALNVQFMPWFVSSHGLTRPGSPVPESEQRYFSIINESIKDTMLSEVSFETIENIKARIDKELLDSVKLESIQQFESQIRKHFTWSMKKCILDYILKEEDEQRRLGVKINFRVKWTFQLFDFLFC